MFFLRGDHHLCCTPLVESLLLLVKSCKHVKQKVKSQIDILEKRNDELQNVEIYSFKLEVLKVVETITNMKK